MAPRSAAWPSSSSGASGASGTSGAVLGTRLIGQAPSAAVSALSAGALDLALPLPALLEVSIATDEAMSIGAFGRRPPGLAAGVSALRRGSGGPPVALGAGTIHVLLSLERPGALVPCDEKRIVNRYVRPLLRALTAAARTQAHFFGRDWVSLAHRPVAWVGFGHDASSKRAVFEAFVAVRVPFASEERASFLGKKPATLEEVAERPVDADRLARAIVDAYARDTRAVELPSDLGPGPPASATELGQDVPWAATREEAIGIVGAGRDTQGVFRVGGDLLVSRDALAHLEARVASPGITRVEIGRLVDETLAAPGVALDGVRTLESIRDVIAEGL